MVLSLLFVMISVTSSLVLFLIGIELITLVVAFMLLVLGYNVERIEACSYLVVYSIIGIIMLVIALLSWYYISLVGVTILDHSYYRVLFGLHCIMLFVIKIPLFCCHS